MSHRIYAARFLLLPTLILLLAFVPARVALSNEASPASRPQESSPAMVRQESFWSASLQQEMPYSVYLPPGYDANATERYPVLYMLHGLGGDNLSWQHDGLFDAATSMIQAGAIPPMIIVTPEGARGYWMDHAGHGPLYGSYIAGDLVSMIDTRYRTQPERDARAIGGMSMGAHGALQLAMNHPDEFAIVGAHSLALRKQNEAFDFFGQGADFQSRDPVSLCRGLAATARHLQLWIDVGSDDPWSVAATAFHQQLQGEQVSHAWHLNPGQHDDAYWSSHVRDYLAFYGAAFRTNLEPGGIAG